jgi:hypothetical protein
LFVRVVSQWRVELREQTRWRVSLQVCTLEESAADDTASPGNRVRDFCLVGHCL